MKKSNNRYRGNICIHRQTCNKVDRCDCFKRVKNCHSCNKCNEFCKHFQPIMCEKLGRRRLVCNSCNERRRCIKDKYFYNASSAQNSYTIQLIESRLGINIEESD